ncbi:hypothetical protein H5V45_06265 [Nocardioides sp. KIGAM211]|uniref:Uncharacterized protein n=1 Tax=Nocardioides luti TaxID=2761101 RepID=A0A7X0VAG1_9ACTN|nr:hypothetical protein [Nocardioides luti]MBB6626922.1 hypothetical protein [Nocardioides luti]
MVDDSGIHLTRTDENAAEIDELAALLGGRVGLDGVLGDLDRRGRRGLAPGLAVTRSLTWDAEDRRTTQWWPQGISTSADASDTGEIGDRRVLAVSWYAQGAGAAGHQGARISFLDLATRRYRHVLLVMPVRAADGTVALEPLRVHAGGIVWCGPYLHVAATARGFHTCRLDDLLRVDDDAAGSDRTTLGVEAGRVSAHGYRYVLPVRFSYRAHAGSTDQGLRYSFMSLDRSATPPDLLVGEYGQRGQSQRLARFPLDPGTLLLSEDEEGRSVPLLLEGGGVQQTQGAAVAGDTYVLTVSHGTRTPGSVYVGRPGRFRRRRWATPMGPEDVAYWPSSDLVWSVSEHPRRRWIFAMKRSRLTR